MKTGRSLLAMAALAMFAWSAQAGGNGTAPKKHGAGTLANLRAAYKGEVSTKAKYAAYAVKAESEAYLGAASLFRAAAFAEGVHAAQFARAIAALGGVPKAGAGTPAVRGTEENLIDALKGETYESGTLYPAFFRQAKADKNDLAMFSFNGALAAEKTHAGYYSEALSDLAGWRAKKKFLVCNICGFTTLDTAIKKCPVSASPREKFTEID